MENIPIVAYDPRIPHGTKPMLYVYCGEGEEYAGGRCVNAACIRIGEWPERPAWRQDMYYNVFWDYHVTFESLTEEEQLLAWIALLIT